MRRLGVFSFSQNSEEKIEHLSLLLDRIRPSVGELITVVPSGALESVYDWASEVSDRVICSEYPDFNVYSYMQAVESLGLSYVQQFDEVVFFDSSFFGPLVAFEEVFASMGCRTSVDFWGLTMLGDTEIGEDSKCRYDVRPEHIQTYFIVLRKAVLSSPAFSDFLSTTPIYEDRIDVLDCVESQLTQRLVEAGFAWDVFVEMRDLISDDPKQNNDLSSVDAFELLSKRNLPIVRQEVFTVDRTQLLRYGTQNSPRQVMAYLKMHYPEVGHMVAQWLLRSQNLSITLANLGELRIIPEDGFGDWIDVQPSAAAILCVTSKVTLSRLASIPSWIELFVLTNLISQDDLDVLRVGKNHVISWNGDKMAAVVLSTMANHDICGSFDYLCFYSDVAPKNASYITVVSEHQSLLWDCTLKSEGYVLNALSVLNQDCDAGLLTCLPPNFGDGFGNAVRRWGKQYKRVRPALEDLGCAVPLEKNVPPAPYSQSFWCKSAIFQSLVSACKASGWKRDDETFLQMIPYIAQAKGYLTTYIMPRAVAESEMTADIYMLSMLAHQLNRLPTVHVNYFAWFMKDLASMGKRARKVGGSNVTERIALRETPHEIDEVAKNKEAMIPIQRMLYAHVLLPHYNEGLPGQWKTHKQLAAALSPTRINPIRWLPVEGSSTILEIGGGYGEYTQYLSSIASKVYCYEPEETRRAIILARCRQHKNMQLISGNLREEVASITENIDWVIIHNVEVVFASRDELEETLKLLGSLPGIGHVVVLSSNKNGCRFATESHFIETAEIDASTWEGATRLTEGEYCSALENAGLSEFEVYYPYPDHVFAKTLYSAESLPSEWSVIEESWRLRGQRLQSPDERVLLRDVVAEGSFASKANSLLIIAHKPDTSKDEDLPSSIRFPSDRKDRFALMTAIYSKERVDKTALSRASFGHIRNAERLAPALTSVYARGSITYDPVVFSTDTMTCDFIDGHDLQGVLVELLEKDNKDEFMTLVIDFGERILKSHADGFFVPSAQFNEVFGRPSLPSNLLCSAVTNIDINFDNIIITSDGKYHIIDCEWAFDYPIPADFIVWRTIFYFFQKYKDAVDDGAEALQEACFESFGYDEDLCEQFLKMELSFQRYMGL